MYRTVTSVEDGRPNIRNPTITHSALKVMSGPRIRYVSPMREVRRTGMTDQ
jgi:hypothetical protein